MISRDLVGGLASMTIGAVYLYFAYQLRVSALDDSMGPAGMPRIYGWLLVVLGLVLTGLALLPRVVKPAPAGVGEAAKGEWEGQGSKIVWAAGLLAVGATYLLVVEWLGYLLSVSLLILAAAGYLGAHFGARLAVIAVLGALSLWILFAVILGVSMPSGLLGWIGF